MLDFESIKERVRQRVSLLDLVGEQVTLKRAGRNFVGLCPFHQEKTPSFNVLPDKGIFKCFGCDAAGDVFSFVQRRERVDFKEALRILAERAGVELIERAPGAVSHEPSRADLAKVNAWAADFYRRQLLDPIVGATAREYIDHRGISPETAERFGLGLATNEGFQLLRAARIAGIDAKVLSAAGLIKTGDGRDPYDIFRERLMFPIRDAMGRIVGFGGRALGDSPIKYLNTPQTPLFEKSRCLYGIDSARQAASNAGRVIVVEGYVDCIAAQQAGVVETVATMGTALTDEHVDLLRRYCSKIVFVFDSDAAGQRAVDRAIGVTVKYGLDVRMTHVGEGKDPADFLQNHSLQEFAALLNSAPDALGFKWRQVLTQNGGEGNAQARRAAILDFIRLVAGHARAGSIDAIQKGLIVNEVAKLLTLRADEVYKQLSDAMTAGAPRQEFSTRAAAPIAARGPVWSGDQSLMRTATALLVREPGLWLVVAPLFDAECFEDERLRRVARAVADLADRVGEFSLGELLGKLANAEDEAIATDLVVWVDEMIVDPVATMSHVVERLQIQAVEREARSAGRLLADDGRSAPACSAEIRRSLELVQGAAQRPSFAYGRVSGGAVR